VRKTKKRKGHSGFFTLHNLPNFITCIRLILTGIFLWLLSYE